MAAPLVASIDSYRTGRPVKAYSVSFDPKGELVLPETPEHDDRHGLCAWLSTAFGLDPDHPITEGRRHGAEGPEGHIEFKRAGAPSIRFEPAKNLNAPNKLIETLSWYRLPTDAKTPALKSKHVRDVVWAVVALCGLGKRVGALDEAVGIVSTFLNSAVVVEGYTTVGTSPQRFEAATALQRDLDESSGRPIGAPRCLLDVETGAYVIRVSDLQEIARRYIGGSIPRGFLDARMSALGWESVRLDGHASTGTQRAGNPHARCRVYVGFLPAEETE